MALNGPAVTKLATNDYCDKRVSDIYFTENVLLNKLMGKGGMENNFVRASELVDGGTRIRVPLEHAKANGGSYGKNTTINAAKVDLVNAARFRWSGEYASNTIDLEEQTQNMGDAALVDLVMTKMKNIEKTIRDNMGSKVYTAAADSDCILGLPDLFSTVTATTYGEIAEDDMALWKANSSANAVAISFKVLQDLCRTAQVGQSNSAKPNLIITTNTPKDGYERVLQVQQRFADVELVKAGFTNILHGGFAPVVGDDNCTSGYVMALNLRHLAMKTHKDYNFTKPVWEKDRLQPDTLTANTRWYGQLVTSHRKAHARYTGVLEPS